MITMLSTGIDETSSSVGTPRVVDSFAAKSGLRRPLSWVLV